MNKKLELEFSEYLIASDSDNVDRMGRILHRLSFDQREKLSRALIKGLYPTLYSLPGERILAFKKEYGFEIDQDVKEEITNANNSPS